MPESHTKIAVLYNRGPAVAMKETMVLPRAPAAVCGLVEKSTASPALQSILQPPALQTLSREPDREGCCYAVCCFRPHDIAVLQCYVV